MSEILLSYAGVALIAAAGLLLGLLFIVKRFKYPFKLGAFSVGIISAIGAFLCVFLLFKMLFNTNDFYNTMVYRVIVGLVILSIFAFLRFLLVRGVCFNRYREESGVSFSFGFGMAPLALFGIYSFILFLVLVFNVVFNAPYTFGEDGLTFADNTMISVPIEAIGQVFYALALLFYETIVMVVALFMDRATKRPYRTWAFVVCAVLFFVLESAAILPIPFAGAFGLLPWHIALILGIIALVAIAVLAVIPSQKTKKSTYTKQFE